MGIFGVIGKMAGSKIIDKVEDELKKDYRLYYDILASVTTN